MSRNPRSSLGFLLTLLVGAILGTVFYANAQTTGGGVTYIPISKSSTNTWTAEQTFSCSSGVCTLIDASTTTNVPIYVNALTSGESVYGFKVAGTDSGYVGTVGTANQLVTGSAVGDLVVRPVSGSFDVTVNNGTSIAFQIASSTGAVNINGQATTGAQTATFTSTNKPGAASGSPQKWLPVTADGTTYYIPLFN